MSPTTSSRAACGARSTGTSTATRRAIWWPSHDGFQIIGEGKGEGIGKQVLKAQFDEYERMGVTRAKVHANIDVGGYAWARFGFVPSQRSWNDLRESLKVWVNADEVTQRPPRQRVPGR